MCLAIPGRIIDCRPESEKDLATGIVEFDGLRRAVCLSLVPEARPGDYVLVHAGIALNKIDAEEAERIFNFLREMEEEPDLPEG